MTNGKFHGGTQLRSREGFVGTLVFGILLLGLSVFGVFWNESRAVTTTHSLHEGRGVVVSTPLAPVDANLEGKLVHVQGEGKVEDTLRDDALGVSRVAVRLRRKVEMFQWVEKGRGRSSDRSGAKRSSTPSSYETKWDEKLHKSSEFEQPQGHENPASMEFTSRSWNAAKVTFGPRRLSPGLLQDWNDWKSVEITEKDLQGAGVSGPLHVWGGQLYRGDDPKTSHIGDLRIFYEMVPPGPISLVARQQGTSFDAYPTRSGDSLEFLYPGLFGVDEVFAKEHSRNAAFTWTGRLLGFLAMWIGIGMLVDPLRRLASWIPFLGGLLESAVGLVSFLMAVSLTLITVAVAWFTVRPMLSLGLVIGVGLLILVGKKLAK